MIIFTVTVAIGVTVSTIVGAVDPGDCAGGLGQWSVPINTILLIVLALTQARTRKKVEDVKAVTDTVALRKKPRRVYVEDDQA